MRSQAGGADRLPPAAKGEVEKGGGGRRRPGETAPSIGLSDSTFATSPGERRDKEKAALFSIPAASLGGGNTAAGANGHAGRCGFQLQH